MRTFQAATNPDGRLLAFEIENIYISPSTAAQLLQHVDGVTDVKLRRVFSRSSDVHVRFNYRGHACLVWEPYGDSSRYWIGPERPEAFPFDVQSLQVAFEKHTPPVYRTLIGDILSLRFLRQ